MRYRNRIAPLPAVDLADPTAVASWLTAARERVDSMRSPAIEATTRKAHRKHSRRYLRRTLARAIRDVEAMLDALAPPDAAATMPPPDDDRPPWEAQNDAAPTTTIPPASHVEEARAAHP
jgi:hypothetical protein